jgi:hypothetical protein
MTIVLHHDQLETLLLQLDPADLDCRAKIKQLRRLMDEACDQRTINMQQWRTLLERISFLQARHALLAPDAWRHPPTSHGDSTKSR